MEDQKTVRLKSKLSVRTKVLIIGISSAAVVAAGVLAVINIREVQITKEAISKLDEYKTYNMEFAVSASLEGVKKVPIGSLKGSVLSSLLGALVQNVNSEGNVEKWELLNIKGKYDLNDYSNPKIDSSIEFKLPPGTPMLNIFYGSVFNEDIPVLREEPLRFEVRRVDNEKFFWRISSMPLQLVDFYEFYYALRGRWIEMPLSQVGDLLYLGGPSLYSSGTKENSVSPEEADQIAQEIAAIVENTDFFESISTLNSEVIDGVNTDHFRYVIDKEAIAEFIIEIYGVMGNHSDVTGIQPLTDQDKNQIRNDMKEVMGMINEIKAEFWIGKDDKYIRRANFSIRLLLDKMMPGIDELKNGEMTVELETNLSKINKPVLINMPSGAISENEAESLVDNTDVVKDTDEDGIPDYIESIWGTDINKIDTDGDSVSDLQELQNGTNPLGSGSLPNRLEQGSQWMTFLIIPARKKAENARMVAQIRSLSMAISGYYDANGLYPTDLYGGQLAPFIASVPKDINGNKFYYAYQNDGQAYHIGVTLNNPESMYLEQDADFNSNISGWTRVDNWNGTGTDPVYDLVFFAGISTGVKEETLLKADGSPKIYVIRNGRKKIIPNEAVFYSYGYKWDDVKTVNQWNLDQFQDVRLIREKNDYKVYEIIGDKRHWLPSGDILASRGYWIDEVVEVNKTDLQSYKRVKLLRAYNSDDIYYLTEGGMKRLIPNTVVFNSYGNRWEDVITISSKELALYPTADLVRAEGDYKVYKIENGTKRWVVSSQAAAKHGIDLSKVVPCNSVEIESYPEGPNIE